MNRLRALSLCFGLLPLWACTHEATSHEDPTSLAASPAAAPAQAAAVPTDEMSFDAESGEVEFKDDFAYFDFEESTLMEDAKGQLKVLAKFLVANPQATLAIRGYADGHDDDNDASLAQRRAAAIQGFLASEGVAMERMLIVGAGDKANPDEDAVWMKNRRAELVVTGVKAAGAPKTAAKAGQATAAADKAPANGAAPKAPAAGQASGKAGATKAAPAGQAPAGKAAPEKTDGEATPGKARANPMPAMDDAARDDLSDDEGGA